MTGREAERIEGDEEGEGEEMEFIQLGLQKSGPGESRGVEAVTGT